MPVFQVDITWPSGKKMRTNVMPGSPHVWCNRGKAPKHVEPRGINSMDDAVEYCMGAMHNKVTPLRVEWPDSVKPVAIIEETEEFLNVAAAAVKALGEDPGKPEKAVEQLNQALAGAVVKPAEGTK